MNYILDTHIILWWLSDSSRLTPNQKAKLSDSDNKLYISSISLWEIAMLVERKRIEFSIPLINWLNAAIRKLEVIDITTNIAVRVSELPESFHRDPADRIIVATAIEKNFNLITSDKKIVDLNLIDTIN